MTRTASSVSRNSRQVSRALAALSSGVTSVSFITSSIKMTYCSAVQEKIDQKKKYHEKGAVCEFGTQNLELLIQTMYPKGNLFIPASHGQLEAIIKEPAGERRGVGLVCHPHPLGGGTMHNKVEFRETAGLVDVGLTINRRNFRGVETS